MIAASLGIAPPPVGASGPRNRQKKAAAREAVAPLEQTFSMVSAGEMALPQQGLAPLEPQEALRHVIHRTRAGDTLAKLLVRFGVPRKDRRPWIRSIVTHYPSQVLPTGREVHFYFAKVDSPARGPKRAERLKALEIDLNEDWSLAWEKGEKEIVFQRREKPYDVELKTVGGVVENSLFYDGMKAGMNSSLLSQLADIFTWEVDLEKDIKQGDSFKIVYEQKTRTGRQAKPSLRILAAELINSGQRLFAIYFEKERGKGSYYDLDGRTLARAFLRFPLEFTSITSHFSHARFHPILKVDRPHHGVDFAAKRGTPVRAIGDGVIDHAGWKKGGYGRMIEIRHAADYASRYAHLQGFARGIRRGAAVKKGQIIGYVGSSGRSTGAHLHFELYKSQDYIDPLTFDVPPEDRIEPALQKLFDNAKQLFLVELAFVPHS